jgi:para-nitrobenzyl esterase
VRPVALVVVVLVLLGCAETLRQRDDARSLGGSAWQLVRFHGGDGTVLTPEQKGNYTVAFGTDGTLNVRFDCNRGRGSWKSSEKNRIEFGPMALTRAACPPGSLHDHLVKQWPYVRSYVVKDGHLFLSLMADAGIYEFEPLAPAPSIALLPEYIRV